MFSYLDFLITGEEIGTHRRLHKIAASVVVAALIIRSGSPKNSVQQSGPLAPSLSLPLPVHFPAPNGGPRNKEFIAIPKVSQSDGAVVSEWQVCFVDGLSLVKMRIWTSAEWARDRQEELEEMASTERATSDHRF